MSSSTWTIPAAAAKQEEEEENGVVASELPLPPPCKVDDAAVSASASKRCRVQVTMSHGLIIAGLVFFTMLLSTSWPAVDLPATVSSFLLGNNSGSGARKHRPHHVPSSEPLPITFSCSAGNHTTCRAATAPSSPFPSSATRAWQQPPPDECPDYFRYIHSDLEPWRETGITREAVERAGRQAHFRLVVVSGRAYVVPLRWVFQTRDVFTQWGILQLLSRYPGRVPDLDIMFNMGDMPEVHTGAYPNRSAAPPLFSYCKIDNSTLDVLFPDWSFWGWPEVNILPWAPLLDEVARENAAVPWPDREPYAYWKGNAGLSQPRRDLMRCNANVSNNVRAFGQDWRRARLNGFRDSNLAKQCRYRYKMYAAGRAWSVSRKYILACDSPVLSIDTPYQDFFSRGLVAGAHYWPISAVNDTMCRDIRLAVDWGNAHPAAQAQRVGLDGSAYVRDQVAMDYVYDYMLHLLTQYAGLLRYKPTVPERAVELCLESMACSARGRVQDFMMQSMERYVAVYEPCTLPPPLSADELRVIARRDDEARIKIDKITSAWKN